MRAFVTGSTGFVGKRLVDQLLAHGYQVSALVRTFERARSLPPGVRIVPGDITRGATMRAAMAGADVVFHMAALVRLGLPPKQRQLMRRINVEGTRQVLELAAELGVPRIVYTSTLAVYGDTRGQLVDEAYPPAAPDFASEYQRTKHQAHFEVAVPLQQQGAPVVIVCPGTIYGPGDTSQLRRLLRLYARRRLWAMVDGQNARTWAHVDDVAAGHRLAAEKGNAGETYFLAGPAHTYPSFFRACERATGIPGPRFWLPARLAGLAARGLRPALPAAAELLQTQAGVTYLGRADKAGRELGWTARTVEAGMPETIAWLKSVA